MEHWSDELETTTEVKTAMQKYGSQEDFRVGAVNAMKTVGAPFRLPKSLDSLPDDTVRADFSSQVGKLMGAVQTADDLGDVNFAEGLADAKDLNDNVKQWFSDFIVQTNMPKGRAKQLIASYNKFFNVSKEARAKTRSDGAAKVLEEVESMFGGTDGVKKNNDLVKRLFDKHGGLTTEEHEELGGIIKAGASRHVILNKALFNLAKAVVTEGTTEPGEDPGSTEQTEEDKLKEQMAPTAKALGW